MPRTVYECDFCDEVFDYFRDCEKHEERCVLRPSNEGLAGVRRLARDFVPSRYVPNRVLAAALQSHAVLCGEDADDFMGVLCQEPIPALWGCATCTKAAGGVWDVECLKAGDYPRINCNRWDFDTHFGFADKDAARYRGPVSLGGPQQAEI